MIWLYRLLFPVGLLLLGPFYLWRRRKRGGQAESFGQRLGFGFARLPPRREGVPRYWIQAVSVGEALGVEPLISALLATGAEVVLTTTTSTGQKVARERYTGRVLAIGYLPVDFWPCMASAWKAFDPDRAILMEGELWPEFLTQARRRGVPVARVNARMSDRSFSRMTKVRPLAAWLLGMPDLTLCGSEPDCGRMIQLGSDAATTRVTGSLKVDVALGERVEGCGRLDLMEQLGFEDRPVIVGASTWPGEEEALLAAFGACREAGQDVRLLLVPRHAERREEVAALVAAGGHAFHLRSRGVAPGPVAVCLADTTGELKRLVQLGTVVFVGKSLPPHTEGQTPIEAAGLGLPVVFGPGMANFRTIAADLVERGAAVRVQNAAGLGKAVRELLGDPDRREALGRAGAAWHAASRGAVARTIRELQALRARRA